MRYQSSSEQSPVTLLSSPITVKFRCSLTLEDLSPQEKKVRIFSQITEEIGYLPHQTAQRS